MKANNRMQNIVWGALLILFGVLALVQTYIDISAWVWVAILGVAGLAVLAVYLSDRSSKALLIAVYVLWVLAFFLAFLTAGILSGPFVPFFVLTAVAIPFILAFLQDRRRWAFLIPAYVLLVVGLMVLLLESGVLSDLLVPAYVMIAIAVPFFAVYFWNRQNWWALIPAGILLVIGFAFLFAEAAAGLIVPAALILIGIGILLRQFLGRTPPSDDAPVQKDSVE